MFVCGFVCVLLLTCCVLGGVSGVLFCEQKCCMCTLCVVVFCCVGMCVLFCIDLFVVLSELL